jgi:2-oxoisovalerate dehydrogenase E1 component alpha subunit
MLRSLAFNHPRRLVPYSRTFTRSARVNGEDSRAAHVPANTTTQLNFVSSISPDGERMPAYRVLDGSGNVLDGAELPEVSGRVCKGRARLK